MDFPWRHRGRLLAVLALVAAAGGTPTHAGQHACTAGSVVIRGSQAQDVLDGCEAVRRSAPFFELAGLAVPKDIAVELVDVQLPRNSDVDAHVIGQFDARSNTIAVLAYRPALALQAVAGPGLGHVAFREHWRSYIVHELAHAAVHRECDRACPSRAVHEYIAAVAQLSALPPAVRAELLEGYRDLEAFSAWSEVTEIYYAINPHYFAIKSYKHFAGQPDPRAFLRRILHPEE